MASVPLTHPKFESSAKAGSGAYLTPTDIDELRYRLRRIDEICEAAASSHQGVMTGPYLTACAITIGEAQRLLDRVECRRYEVTQ